MFFNRLLIVVSLVLSGHRVSATPSDVAYLKEHFFENLFEENRGISSLQLTDDVEREINLKIEGFLDVISEPVARSSRRSSRDTNDLLLNEKPNDVFILKGFESRGFIPVNFPQDICMFKVDEKKFAAGLTYGKSVNGTTDAKNKLLIFVRENQKFRQIYEYESSFLTKMDCDAIDGAGFVAVVNSLKSTDVKQPDELAEIGSFIIRITLEGDGKPKVEVLQRIAMLNQNGVKLYSRSSDSLYLVFSYNTFTKSSLNVCTVFKLAGTNFNPLDDLPCQNARVIEFFTVHHNLMILIGNYRENNGTTNAFSTVMRYDLDQKRFIEHQKITSKAIAVGRYFFLDHQNQRQHFLFIGNTFEINEFGQINHDVPSMIYKYANGYFIPMQTISVRNIQSVLPIIGKDNQFNLLIASEEREVQIYFYDGWKFQDSPIDFTGDAFGSGVINMRSYDDIINGTITIVISNRDSFDPTFNVYTPIYAVKNDTSRLKSSISKWCSDAFERVETFDIEQADKNLKASLELLNPSSDHAVFTGNVSLRNSNIGAITANEFKGTRVAFNNATAQRFNSLSDRLTKLTSSVEHVMNKIRFTKATQRSKRQAPLLIRTLIVDGPINVKSINGNPITDLVYKSSDKNSNLRDVIAKNIFVNEFLTVSGKVDGIEVADDNIFLSRPTQDLRAVTASSVQAVKVSQVSRVNLKPFGDFFTQLRRKVDKKIPNKIYNLQADAITINRFLNTRNFTGLAINSLKTFGDQVLTGSTHIGKLKANSIIFEKDPRNHKISNVPISSLINIEETRGRVEIRQDIRFTEELSVDRLVITERINNVNVLNGQLQVLRKRGPTSQVVTGEKFFDKIHLKSPIVLQGKIESKTLEKMNPIATINENIVLQGDYKITGPVTIRRFINATEDISSSDTKLSLKNLVDNGLNLHTTTSTKNNLVFKNVVEVKRNLEAVSLNEKPVASFVKSNFPDLQTIHGTKTFRNGLGVHGGIVHADVINDVDVNQLNKTVLKRSSHGPQFIDGNVEMMRLETPLLVSSDLNVNGKSSKLLLNVHKKQELGVVTLPQAKVRSLEAKNVHQQPGAKIFGTDLNSVIDDTITAESLVEGVVVAEKTFTDLNVEHLTFSDGNEWKSIIANYENSIAHDLNMTGDLIISNPVNIENLYVTGTINGVSYNDMMYQWLQVEGDQTFTAPQEISSVEIESNLLLTKEQINGVNIGTMVADSIWIDEPVYLESIEFKDEITVSGKVLAQTVNGMSLNGKLILNNTSELQKISKLEINDITVQYLNFTNLNGIDLVALTNYFDGHSDMSSLNIEGTAYFNQLNATYLNNKNLQELCDSIWMSDQDVVLTGDDIQFLGGVKSNGYFYSNTFNGKDLDYYYRNYFSLTRNQNIETILHVNGAVEIKKSLSTQKTIVQGSIKTDLNEKGLKIDEFASQAFRLDQPQAVKGRWKVNKLIIEGDWNGTINGFSFYDDVLHKGNWETAKISGSKKIHSIETYNVVTQFVNQIDIVNWMENAIILNSSSAQAVAGRLVVGETVFHGDVGVLGLANGIKIGPQSVLTKSGEGQVINGDLTILTMTDKTVKPCFIEKLALDYGINGKDLTDAYLNTLKTSDTSIDSKQIVFENKLLADSIETDKNIYGVDIANFLKESDESSELVSFQNNLKHLSEVGDSLRASLDDGAVELNHFEYHQSLFGVNIQKTVPMTIQTGSSIEFLIAAHERDIHKSLEVIKFYRWNSELHIFVNDTVIAPLQYGFSSYQITSFDKVVYKGVDHLFVEIFDKASNRHVQSLMIPDVDSNTFIDAIKTEAPVTSRYFTLGNGSSSCYGAFFPSLKDIHIFCDEANPTVLETDPIRQVSSQNEIIILLTDDRQLQIWHQEKIRQVLKVMNPQSYASTQFGEKYYIAVASDKVEQSIHHGSIEIFESGNDIHFQLVQSFEMENPFMVQFSMIPSGDLMLYILTKNPGKALSIYQFAGASYFVENTGSSTIVNTGTHLSTITVDGKTEFIAIISGEVFIIEVILNEF